MKDFRADTEATPKNQVARWKYYLRSLEVGVSGVYAQDLAIRCAIKTDEIKIIPVERHIGHFVGDVGNLPPSCMGRESGGWSDVNRAIGDRLPG